MKLIDKKELKQANGYLVDNESNVWVIPGDVIFQYNRLDRLVQKSRWLAAQPKPVPMADPDEFVPESEVNVSVEVDAETPCMDAKLREAAELMKEIERSNRKEELDDMVQEYQRLINFVDSDKALVTDGGTLMQIDAPVLGSILDITVDKVLAAFGEILSLDPMHDGEQE